MYMSVIGFDLLDTCTYTVSKYQICNMAIFKLIHMYNIKAMFQNSCHIFTLQASGQDIEISEHFNILTEKTPLYSFWSQLHKIVI